MALTGYLLDLSAMRERLVFWIPDSLPQTQGSRCADQVNNWLSAREPKEEVEGTCAVSV